MLRCLGLQSSANPVAERSRLFFLSEPGSTYIALYYMMFLYRITYVMSYYVILHLIK